MEYNNQSKVSDVSSTTEPVDSEPVESDPIESEPVVTEPVESEPASSAVTDTDVTTIEQTDEETTEHMTIPYFEPSTYTDGGCGASMGVGTVLVAVTALGAAMLIRRRRD